MGPGDDRFLLEIPPFLGAFAVSFQGFFPGWWYFFCSHQSVPEFPPIQIQIGVLGLGCD